MSRAVELLNNLQKNSSLAGGFSAAVGSATKNFIKGNLGGGSAGGNNQDATRIPSSTYWKGKKPIEETLEANEKGHPVSKDVASVDDAIKNQEGSMDKLAKLKEMNARKDLRMAKYKEAGAGKVFKNIIGGTKIADNVNLSDVAKMFKKDPSKIKEAFKKLRTMDISGGHKGVDTVAKGVKNIGIPAIGALTMDKYVGEKLEHNPVLRGAADMTAATILSPHAHRRLKRQAKTSNLEQLIKGGATKKHINAYAKKINKAPEELNPLEMAKAQSYAVNKLKKGKANKGTTTSAMQKQLLGGALSASIPVTAGAAQKFTEKGAEVLDMATSPVEAPDYDPVTGKARLDAEGKPILVTKPFFKAQLERGGSTADSIKEFGGNLAESAEKMTGEDNFMDKMNEMAGGAKEYFDIFKEQFGDRAVNMIEMLNKHRVPVGAGAIGVGTLFLYVKWKRSQEEKRKKEEELQAKQLQTAAYRRLAQMS